MNVGPASNLGAVPQAFAWYKANMEQKKDEKRYMFVMIRPKGGAAAEESRCGGGGGKGGRWGGESSV